jgi:hypothetical protein
MENTVLKYIIENPQWIDKLNLDLFIREHKEILGTAKYIQDKKLEKATFQSIEYILEKNDKELAVQSLRQIQNETSIDYTTFRLQLEDVRTQAELRLIQRLQNSDVTDEKVRQDFYKRIVDIQTIEKPEDKYEISSFFDYQDFIQTEEEIVQTFAFLDDTGAELFLGALCTIIALTGGGKSLVKGVLTRKLIEMGRKVLYVGFEEMKTDFNIRIGRGVLNKTEYEFKQLNTEEIRDQLRGHYNQKGIEKGELDFMQSSTLYIEDLDQTIEELEAKQGYKYDVVMIDYSEYVKVRKLAKNKARHDEIAEVFRALKEFAMKPNNKRLVITSVQSNRDAYKKTMSPKLEHLAGSMAPAHNSDLVLGIFRLPANRNATEKIEAHKVKPTDITSHLQFTVRKKRKGSISEGQTFYYDMRADNNLVPVKTEDIPTAAQLFDLNSLEDLDKYD